MSKKNNNETTVSGVEVVKARNLFSFVVEKVPFIKGECASYFKNKILDTAYLYLSSMVKEYKQGSKEEEGKRESTSYLYVLNALFDVAYEKKYITDGIFSEFGAFFSSLTDW